MCRHGMHRNNFTEFAYIGAAKEVLHCSESFYQLYSWSCVQDISFLWNVILITAIKTPQLIPILNQLIPVSPFSPMFPPKYSKQGSTKLGMVIISLLPAKISVRIYFKLRFYTKKPHLARAYDAICQHRYLQQTVNNVSCFQVGRVKNKLFVPTDSSST